MPLILLLFTSIINIIMKLVLNGIVLLLVLFLSLKKFKSYFFSVSWSIFRTVNKRYTFIKKLLVELFIKTILERFKVNWHF